MRMEEMQFTFIDLPDNFMLSIFKCFSLTERIKLTSVCKSWYRYIHDPCLWKHLDLRQYSNKLTLNDLINIIQQYGSSALLQINLIGNCTDNKNSNTPDDNEKITHLNQKFFSLLQTKCVNLQHVSLEYLNLTNIRFNSILNLKNLKEISFKWCVLGETFFQLHENENQSTINTTITSLNLIRTYCNLNDVNMEYICKSIPNLKSLAINEIKSSINDSSIKILVTYIDDLEKLELINTRISDSAVECLCFKYYLNLKYLNLSLNSYLTNTSIFIIGNYLNELCTLYLTSCFYLTNIDCLKNLFKLRYLNLNNTSISKAYIKEFILTLNNDQCEIEYGHEKMLKLKEAWTINGSKNSVCSF